MSAKWYIVNVDAKAEDKVAKAISVESVRRGIENQFEEILVPSEIVIELKRGRKQAVDRKFYPGYVFVKMTMTDESFHLVNRLPRVRSFSGSKKNPLPVSEAEMKQIKGRFENQVVEPQAKIVYEIGERVTVLEGAFMGFSGIVDYVDEVNQTLKVAISIFGRATPVEAKFTQVEKPNT
jgi:transcriptional antiterminator NusG